MSKYKGKDPTIIAKRRLLIKGDVLAGMGREEMAARHGIAESTLFQDLYAVTEMIKGDVADVDQCEWALKIKQFGKVMVAAWNAWEESRKKRIKCQMCKGTGFVKVAEKRRSGSYTNKYERVRCPKKFASMAWEDGRVMLHRLVVAKELGRCLTKEEAVHHIDQDEQNDKPENLMLFKNDDDHQKWHNGHEVEVVWSGNPNVRPIVEREWCDDCDGSGFVLIKVPGDPRFLKEVREVLIQQCKLQCLYPEKEKEKGPGYEIPQVGARVDTSRLPPELVLEALKLNEKAKQYLLPKPDEGIIIVEEEKKP